MAFPEENCDVKTGTVISEEFIGDGTSCINTGEGLYPREPFRYSSSPCIG